MKELTPEEREAIAEFVHASNIGTLIKSEGEKAAKVFLDHELISKKEYEYIKHDEAGISSLINFGFSGKQIGLMMMEYTTSVKINEKIEL